MMATSITTTTSTSKPRSGFYKVLVGVHKFIIDKRYQQLKLIGDGSYGLVASAIDTITGNQVAVKKIRDTFLDVVDAKRILRELKLLRHFNQHENIISILDIMVYPLNTVMFEDIYIVTNLYESDLERIIRSKQQLTDRHLQFFLYQLLRGLKYVHSANVLHRDLKPSNVLVNANCDLAICDFGLARGFDIEGDDTLTTYVVTRWYRAPEILCNLSSYGRAIDIWSVGCIFAEMMNHQPFFRGENPQHQLLEIIRKDRITVDEALQHPYLKDFTSAIASNDCPTVFDFEFEHLIEGETSETKEVVRYLMYEEMRRYRVNAPAVTPPWLMSPATRQRSFKEDNDDDNDGKRTRIGSTPRYDHHHNTSLNLTSMNKHDHITSSSSYMITPRDDDDHISLYDDTISEAMLTARDDDQTPVANLIHGSSYFGHDAKDIHVLLNDDDDDHKDDDDVHKYDDDEKYYDVDDHHRRYDKMEK